GVNDSENTIDLGYVHNFSTGDRVVYSVGGDPSVDGEIGGLRDGDTYYVQVMGPTRIRLARSPLEASAYFGPGSVVDNANQNQIDLGYVHGFQDGDAVVYNNGGGADVGGLVNGKTYYVLVVDATHIQLAETLADVEDGTALPLDLVAHPGSGTAHSLRLAVSANGVTGKNHNFGRAFNPVTSIVDGFESIDLGYEHGFKAGQAVMYLTGGGTPIGGLENGKIYY